MKFVITIDTSIDKKITPEQAQIIFDDITNMLNGFCDASTYDTLLNMQKLYKQPDINEIHGSTEYPYYGVNVSSIVNTETNVQMIR